ncbi:lymphotactin-like [Leptodactylus fuscus]|uniref:lymphotactin-like n=1 Tax=Leptodactylus fuscus TaxID=238119 RepID=UPI003F4EF234
MKIRHIPLLTFIGVVLSLIESQGLGFDHKDPYTCLEVQTRRVNTKFLQSYMRKHFPVEAVLFFGKNGTMICADPNQAWVKKAIIALDKQAQTPLSNEGGNNNKAKKPKKPAKKKTLPKRKAKPSKKKAPVKSIISMLTTRTPAVKP